MRKHNEGYVLPLVLVVMVILSLIAVGVMSVSLRNLQTQKADIERMQAQYEAQGELEKVTALLSNLSTTEINLPENAKKEARTLLKPIIGYEIQDGDWSGDANGYHCAIVVSVKNADNTVMITSEILLENLVIKGASADYYKVNPPNIVFKSYEVSTITETTPETSETGVTE